MFDNTDQVMIDNIIEAFRRVTGDEKLGFRRRTPAEFARSLVSGLRSGEHAPGMSVEKTQVMVSILLEALVTYSLKNVEWEKFIPEFRVALTEYVHSSYYAAAKIASN